MNCEEWKMIPNYEGLYEASNLGRIRTCEGKTTSSKRFKKRVWKQRVLKPRASNYGRGDYRVELWKDGKHKTYLVARLIALTWCDGYKEDLTVNHINGNFLDNRAENLEWITRTDNVKHGHANGLYRNICKPIQLISNQKVYNFESMSAASRFLGRNNSFVSNALSSGKNNLVIEGNAYEITRCI